jgi:3-oxocholest-4-en-26-oyl-CoA dehydrogenase beta subunit
MDFFLSDEQKTLGEITEQILTDTVTHDRLSELEERGGAVFDRDAWRQLAEAGVLAAVVPGEHGGSGLGIADLLKVLEAAGKTVAPIPLVPTLVLGALPLVRYGTPAQQAAWLPGVADGSVILTAALEEPQISVEGDRLSGEVAAVPYAPLAARALVATDAGVFLVDPSSTGVTLTEQLPTNRQPLADMAFDRATGELLTDDPDAARWITEIGAAAVCALQAGVCEGALRMTARHTGSREQFGKPIAEFQAVAQRAADAFIDTEMVRLTAQQAMFRLGQGWPATNEVHVAKFWAGDGGMRALHAAQHLHGGLGVDTSYPLHRYFLWGKANEHMLGTPTRELLRLGAALADEPV